MADGPTNAVAFFKQTGASLRLNPLPTATTGLNGVPLRTLPSWITPRSGARTRYRNPSYPQAQTLAQFKPLGLTASGPIVQLTNPGGKVDLEWGSIQPVSQLGSQQLMSGKLAKNADGLVTLWIGPKLPACAPATNWIPTPSTAYYQTM